MTIDAPTAVYEIPRLDASAIDGAAADWDQAFHVAVLVPVNSPLPARQTFSAAARLGWNADGLLVLGFSRVDCGCGLADSCCPSSHTSALTRQSTPSWSIQELCDFL